MAHSPTPIAQIARALGRAVIAIILVGGAAALLPPDAAGKPGTRSGAPALLTREPFDGDAQAAAVVPGIADARFWADSEDGFAKALPSRAGPWLVLSAGGADGAFGAGFVSGLWQSGQSPEYAAVTGVSAGALVAVYAFAGPRYEPQLRAAFTTITAADVFEHGGNGESLNDTWPLRALIAKHITPGLMADVAAEHRRGRRLFAVTTNLDAGRGVAWNLGAIAARGDGGALALFRDVLLASASIPGLFPPVYLDVEAGDHRMSEMHADGAIAGPLYAGPRALVSAGTVRGPTRDVDAIVNGRLAPDFAFVPRQTSAILGRAIGTALRMATVDAIARLAHAAEQQAGRFRLAHVSAEFAHPSRGPFDPDYMSALYDAGRAQGAGPRPFRDMAAPAATPVAKPLSDDPTNASGADHAADGTRDFSSRPRRGPPRVSR